MTQPVPPALPTQVRHPNRAVFRTAVAVVLGLLPLVPEIAIVGHVDTWGWVTQLVAIAAGVTRVLALPGVETLLKRYAPWLAAAPK